MTFVELKFTLEKWRKAEYDVGGNGVKRGLLSLYLSVCVCVCVNYHYKLSTVLKMLSVRQTNKCNDLKYDRLSMLWHRNISRIFQKGIYPITKIHKGVQKKRSCVFLHVRLTYWFIDWLFWPRCIPLTHSVCYTCNERRTRRVCLSAVQHVCR